MTPGSSISAMTRIGPLHLGHSKTALIIVGLVILAVVGYFFFRGSSMPSDTAPTGTETTGTELTDRTFGEPIEYECAGGMTFTAAFTANGGLARVTLSGAGAITLEKVSEDDSGITFANDTGVSFSVKDFGAFIMENGAETYKACMVRGAFPDVGAGSDS
jgi:hypothetical protein